MLVEGSIDFKHYVYRHIRLDTNMPFYIGVGTHCRRKNFYRAKDRKRSNLWANVVSKTDYRIDILFETNDYEKALEKEKEFILIYGRQCDGGVLVNKSRGGKGGDGVFMTDEQKEHLRIINTGKKHSKESKKKRSNSLKKAYAEGRKHRNGKPVYQYSLNGDFIKKHDTAKEASIYSKVAQSSISRCISTQKNYTMGYFWYKEFKGEKIDLTLPMVRQVSITVTDLKGNIVGCYKTVREATRALFGKDRKYINEITSCCKGKIESYKGYIYSYES